ncbi:hypothetical protein Tco_1400832 [Tanacetum coccineum]
MREKRSGERWKPSRDKIGKRGMGVGQKRNEIVRNIDEALMLLLDECSLYSRRQGINENLQIRAPRIELWRRVTKQS